MISHDYQLFLMILVKMKTVLFTNTNKLSKLPEQISQRSDAEGMQKSTRFFFIRNLPQGLVLKVPYL